MACQSCGKSKTRNKNKQTSTTPVETSIANLQSQGESENVVLELPPVIPQATPTPQFQNIRVLSPIRG